MQSVFSQFSNNNQFSHQTIPVVSTFLALHTFQQDTVHTAFSAAFARRAPGADAFGQRWPLEAAMHTTSGRLRPASAPGSARFAGCIGPLAARISPLRGPLHATWRPAQGWTSSGCAGRLLSLRGLRRPHAVVSRLDSVYFAARLAPLRGPLQAATASGSFAACNGSLRGPRRGWTPGCFVPRRAPLQAASWPASANFAGRVGRGRLRLALGSVCSVVSFGASLAASGLFAARFVR